MRSLALLALLVPCVACDQVTKALAVAHLKGQPGVDVVVGIFRLVYAENPGAFLGLGRALPEGVRQGLFVVGVALLLLGVGVVALRHRLPGPLFVGLGLLIAGGAGNLMDRLSRAGHVVDFAVISVGPLRTGVFNVADVQIVVAGGLLALAARRRKTPHDLGAPAPA